MNNPIISLVVPVYNVAGYLRPCLDSIERQTFDDFEVILINDGSTDGSLRILQEYVDRNEHFTLIDQENKGLGEVRNVGIRHARGEYIAFVDSDDILRKDYLARMYSEMLKRDADIVCCEYKFQLENGFRFRIYPGMYAVSSQKKAISRLMRDVTLHHFSWNKLYRRSLFTENNIIFPAMCFEDIATTARVFYHAKKIAFIPQPLYYYVQRGSSIMHSITYRRLQDHINSAAILRAFFEQTGELKNYRRALKQGIFVIRSHVILDLITMHLQDGIPYTGRDLKNALRQFRAIESPQFTITGEPWEDIVTSTLFAHQELPQISAPISIPRKQYSNFCGFQKRPKKEYKTS